MATYSTEVVLEVSPDIHICGFCKQQFNHLEVFRDHKQNGCGFLSSEPVSCPSTAALTDPNAEFVFEETFVVRGAKKSMNKAPKTPSKKLKAALTSKRHSCCFSGCTFKTQYGQKDMERHLKTHTGEKPFECELCHKRFSRRDKLNMHSRCHTGERPHKCKLCSYAAADSSSLKKHLRIHFDERPFKCQICPYASRNSSQLTVHLRSHTGDAPFQCPQCDAKFKINSDLKRHLRIHSGEKPYKCDFCDYRCAMKGNLKSHVHIRHGPERSLTCAQCDFSCTDKASLRQHAREHQPAQAVRCPACTYSCGSQGALRVHERVHSDERPFKCPTCDFSSKQRSNLLLHRRKSHQELEIVKGKPGKKSKHGEVSKPASSRYRAKLDAAKAFSCDFCAASFVREDSLRSHKKQHQEKPVALGLVSAAGLLDFPAGIEASQLKIFVSQELENKANVMLLSRESQSMVVNSMLQQVNLQPIVTSSSFEAALEPQAVLLTHLSSDDSSFLHQPQEPSSTAPTFICSELESLKALIQEGGTEVTVVTVGDALSSANQEAPSEQTRKCSVMEERALACEEEESALACEEEEESALACEEEEEEEEESALLVPDLSLSQNVVLHNMQLIVSTRPETSEGNRLPQTIYCNSETLENIPH